MNNYFRVRFSFMDREPNYLFGGAHCKKMGKKSTATVQFNVRAPGYANDLGNAKDRIQTSRSRLILSINNN